MCKNKTNCSCSCSKKTIKESLSPEARKELIKQVKTGMDAIYSTYKICENKKVNQEKFFNLIDESFEKLNEALNFLVIK